MGAAARGGSAPGRGARGLLPPPPSRRRGQRTATLATPRATQAPRGAFSRVPVQRSAHGIPRVSRRQVWEGAGPVAGEAGGERGRERGREEGGGAALSYEPREVGKGGAGGAGLPSASQREMGKSTQSFWAFGRKVSCRRGRTDRPAPVRGREGEGLGETRAVRCGGRRGGAEEMDGCCLPPCAAGLQLGARGGLRPPPSLPAWLPAPPGGGRACPPALLAPSRRLSEEMAGPWAGAPGALAGAVAAERCARGARSARAGAGAPLGCSPTQARAPATVLKGQLPDCCGAARSWAGVLRAGFRLRGYRALAPVPLRPGLRAPLRAGGRRCRPRRGGCGCRAREAGVAGPGASRRGRRGEAQSGRRRRDAAAARAAARLVFWLAS